MRGGADVLPREWARVGDRAAPASSEVITRDSPGIGDEAGSVTVRNPPEPRDVAAAR